MKKTILLLIACMSLTTLATAQNSPHWTFAKDFGGMTGDAWDPNNIPAHMEMDSHGNVYIFGTYGQMMSIDTTYLPTAGTDNHRASFLAKFDCQGNLLWTKAVNCQQRDVNANWMQIKNDTIYIMGDFHLDFTYATYFLDTMIYGNQLTYPYTYPWIPNKDYNYFAKISPDGEILENHFLHSSIQFKYFFDKYAPFYQDGFNNTYMLSQYLTMLEPYSETYSYYIDSIPVINNVYYNFDNWILTKYDTDFNPMWHKPLIDSLSTWQINLNFNDMATDADNNMYYVGKATLIDSVEPYNPPGTIYLADGHSIEFQQHGKDIGFVMKIDSAGTIQWVEQMYRETDTTVYGNSEFSSIDINEESGVLFITGHGGAKNSYFNEYYSIFPNGDAFEAPCFDCNGNTANASFLISLNKDSGDLIWHKTPHTEHLNYFGNVEYANDSLYVGLRWAYGFHFQDTVYTHDGTKANNIGFSHLTYNTAGELCSVRNLRTDNGFEVWAHDTKVDAAGNLFFTGRIDADLDFEGDTSLYVSNKSMFLARYGKNCPVHLDSIGFLCHGESLHIGGQNYSGSGTYTALLENPGGDTIINLNIETLPALSSELPTDTVACLNNSFLLTAAPGYESYLWQDGSTGQMFSTMYSSEQTDTLTVTMGKTFNTAQGDMYCEWTDTIFVSAEICSSYVLQEQASLALYPNPTSSSTKLVFPATQNASLLLYDNSGRLVQQTKISGSSYTLKLSNLETGIYHIKLISNDYNLSEKLIKN